MVINDEYGAGTARTLAKPFTGLGRVFGPYGLLCSDSLVSATVLVSARHCLGWR